MSASKATGAGAGAEASGHVCGAGRGVAKWGLERVNKELYNEHRRATAEVSPLLSNGK